MHRKLNLPLILWILGILVPAGIAVHLLHGFQLRRTAVSLLDRGDQDVARGHTEQALANYERYLGFVPGNGEAREKYVRLFDRVANLLERPRVVRLMQQLLRERPDLHDLRYRLVQNLIVMGRIGDAMHEINMLDGHWSDAAELKHQLAWCQDAREQYSDAAKSFRAAVQLDAKRLDSYSLLAEVLTERLNDAAEARRVLDAMVEANPKAYRAFLIRARFLQSRNDQSSADRDLESALALAPEKADVALAVAQRRQTQGKPHEAYALLESATRQDPKEPALYKAMADLKIRAGDRAAALQILDRGLEKLPRDADLLTLQADLLIDQGELGAAARQVKELRRLLPASLLPDFLQARIAVAQARWSEATLLVERCRKQLTSESAWAGRVYALLGACHHQAGDAVQALAAFRQAVQAEPNWTAARAGLGAALLDQGRVDEAVAELQLARAAADPPPELWAALGRALLYRNQRLPEPQRRWTEVDATLARAHAAQPGDQAVTVLEAEVLAARNEFTAARKVLEQARQTKGSRAPLVWCALAELAERQGQHAEADQILAQAATELPDSLEVRMTRCRLWSQRGDLPARQGLAGLADGLDRLDETARLRLRRELAETWTRLGDTGRAEALWRRIAADQPQDVRSRFALVELAVRANQLEQAQQRLAELRKLEGTHGMFWRYGTAELRLLQARGDRRNLAEARKLLADLERQQPDWGRLPVLAARADELEGRFDSAARHYERAVELGEVQPGLVARLLELLLDRREYLRAEEAFGRFLQRRPPTPELARLGAEVAAGNRNDPAARTRAALAVRLPSNDYRDYLWLARIRQRIADWPEAEELLRTAVQQAGHVPDVWVALVEQLGRTDKAADAETLLSESQRTLPAGVRPLAMARCREALHQLAGAEAAYEQALAAQPADFIALAQAAEFYTRQDRTDRAEPLWRRLLSPAVAAPDEHAARARRQLAVLLASRNRTEALSLVQGDSVADERVRLYVQAQDAAELPRVLTQLHASIERQPASPAERLLLAELCLAAGKPAQARTALQPLALQPIPQPQHLARYAQALIQSGDLDDAARTVGLLKRWEPQSPRTRVLDDALTQARATRN